MRAEEEAAELREELKATGDLLNQLHEQISAFKAREALIARLMELPQAELAEQHADLLIETGRA